MGLYIFGHEQGAFDWYTHLQFVASLDSSVGIAQIWCHGPLRGIGIERAHKILPDFWAVTSRWRGGGVAQAEPVTPARGQPGQWTVCVSMSITSPT